MDRILTIGFTRKSAREFFETLKAQDIGCLIDIRLGNTSQLAGFAKGEDLAYFLDQICRIPYRHDLVFAPSHELLDGYRQQRFGWPEYETEYRTLMQARGAIAWFREQYGSLASVCFLCSEANAAQCHRRLLAELIKAELPAVEIVHL